MKFRPLHDRVVVRRIEEDGLPIREGILVPDSVLLSDASNRNVCGKEVFAEMASASAEHLCYRDCSVSVPGDYLLLPLQQNRLIFHP